MVKFVLFDADRVLAIGDYVAVHLERDYGIPRRSTRFFFEGIFMECVIGKKDLKKEIVPYLKKWGWKKSVNEFINYWHKVEHVVNQDLLAYIRKLRKNGVKCCVATNQEKYRLDYMLKDMGFEYSFDKVYGSAHLGYRKPNIQFFEKVLKDLGVQNKKEVLFWDDAEENVSAAKEFGIRAELYTTYNNFERIMRNYIKFT